MRINIDKLRSFYEQNISNMEPDFINAVKDECVGYTLYGITEAKNMFSSVNEILHFMHSYVLNNENILQSVPIIATKNNDNNYPISMRGVHSDLFQHLFESFLNDLDVG